MRYAFLYEIAHKKSFDRIALGHHADDNAEMVLMAMIRGSGPLGLAGIPPCREGVIIRPLFRQTRAEILRYLEENRLDSVSDASNQDLRFLRNRVRHRLMPLIRSEFNPSFCETVNRTADILRDEERWADHRADVLFDTCIVEQKASSVQLHVADLEKLPRAGLRRVLRKAISAVRGDLRRITQRHIESAMGLSLETHGQIHLPGRLRIAREGSRLHIFRDDPSSETMAAETEYLYTIRSPESVRIEEAGVRITFSEVPPDSRPENYKELSPQIVFFDRDKLQFPLTLRNARPGDRFQPLGMNGTQKLKKFFNQRKIPPNQRWKHPILLSGDRIIWIVGLQIEDFAKITAKTQFLLRAELFLA